MALRVLVVFPPLPPFHNIRRERTFCAVNRARSVMNLYDKAPVLGRNVFIAPNALVSGDVKVGNNSSVFYGSVVRGTFYLLL